MQHFINTFYVYTHLIPTDIYPVQYGEEQCVSGHSFGPCIRSNYLLHYVYSGEGILKIDGKEYKVGKGQMFLICPGQLAYYRADTHKPWLYRWIEFNGSMSAAILGIAKISQNSPIFTDSGDMAVGTRLSDLIAGGEMRFEAVMCKFWAFINAMSTEENRICAAFAADYVSKAQMFIKNNIHKPVTVNEISDYIGIDRSYLSRLFKKCENISIQQYMLSLKMNTAAMYLKNPDITVTAAAQSVGYSDCHVFNKAFKRKFGAAPSVWRRKKLWQQHIID